MSQTIFIALHREAAGRLDSVVKRRVRGLALLVFTLLSFGSVTHADSSLHTLVRQYCVDCHDDFTTEGELNLETSFLSAPSAEQRARTLDRMMARVSAFEMPPQDSESLGEEERNHFLEHSKRELNRLAEELRDDPGDVAMPRLAPYEYRNVIRDLSGGVVTNGGRMLPNERGAGEGFANVGAAQVMTLTQNEKYVDAAKDAIGHLRVYPNLDPFSG